MIDIDGMMIERFMKLNYHWSEERVRGNWHDLPKTSQGLLLDAYHRSDDELFFVFQYVRYYLSSRNGKVLEDQIRWTLKYALTIAPLISALPLGREKPFKSKWVGDLVEYSFNSVRINFKPDPASYDLNVLRGAVIMRLLKHFGPIGSNSEEARAIGESWEAVAKHWGHLTEHDAQYAYAFVNNLSSGGSIHLSDGLL